MEFEKFCFASFKKDDRKTQTGAVMDKQHCLNEFAAMASECRQFVEEYKGEQEPID